MSLKDELKDISTDTVKQAIPTLSSGLISAFIAWWKKRPERVAARKARRAARKAAK